MSYAPPRRVIGEHSEAQGGFTLATEQSGRGEAIGKMGSEQAHPMRD